MKLNDIISEIVFKAVRSGGKGGQHVNKVSSKVEAYFDVEASALFSDDEKARLKEKLAGRMNEDGVLKISCDESRSQFKNKEKVMERLVELINAALKVKKARRKTKPTPASVEQRLQQKNIRSLKKQNRKSEHYGGEV
jgi:ribosome-associated protein